MSQHLTVHTTELGTIEMCSGCAGRFFDVFDAQGDYLGTVATLKQARALLKPHGVE
jgi:hypothetical protein